MSEQLPDLDTLADDLLDSSVSVDVEQRLQQVAATVELRPETLSAFDRFRYRLLLFELALISASDRGLQIAMAEGLLAGAIETGDDAWAIVSGSSLFSEVERLAMGTDGSLDLLELLSYAPDSGARSIALEAIEAQGMRRIETGRDSRSIERLLHGRGARDAAYRLEAFRKRRQSIDRPQAVEITSTEVLPEFRRLAIAGGHAQLRVTAAALLERHGVIVTSIPSSRESVRRERDIARALQGCDAAVLLVRQITHSTSDQVRRAAGRLGIPVIFSNALSGVAIERQLFERAS